MQNKLELTDEVNEWVRKAEEDFRAANRLFRPRSSPTYNIVCFCAHQSAEKYLKAYLTAAGKRFAYKHQLEKLLLPVCIDVDPSFEFMREFLRLLDVYSVDYRYPGESANREEAMKAVQAMKKVKKIVREKLGL